MADDASWSSFGLHAPASGLTAFARQGRPSVAPQEGGTQRIANSTKPTSDSIHSDSDPLRTLASPGHTPAIGHPHSLPFHGRECE